MRAAALLITGALALLPVAANAIALEFPANTIQTTKETVSFGSTEFPVDVFADGIVPMEKAQGAVSSIAWKIISDSLSTLQVIEPLRQQLTDAGFEIVLDCETDQCGGYDFRFEMDLLPEPEMHVDLGDFRYITARRMGEAGTPEHICLIVSRGGNAAFIQMTFVGEPGQPVQALTTSSRSTDPDTLGASAPSGPLESQLITVGRAPLEGLQFATGSSRLGPEQFPSLDTLAEYLRSNPSAKVALVGHTDAEGTLANNLALSEKRAASVMQRLVDHYGLPASQLEAAGVGFLVPLASNQTEDGRLKNRRVEVILKSIGDE